MPINKKQQGFTLIELMIVVAIVGILAAFAYPSYVAQVQKSKRSDAQVGLQQIAERQEAFYVRKYVYATSLTALGYAANTIDSPGREYDLSVQAGSTAQAYTLRAVPKASSGQRSDKRCAVFTLDQVGRKAAQDSSGAASAVCW